ncbi:MAG: hypothetical protein U5J99_05560 [Parvularculaceae bacterium]|nr:hypothetical protein [Parvularculaceae bacterium]
MQPVVPTVAEIEQRIVRYRDLKPCRTAFIDSRSPGSDKKENFTIIGPGVSESKGQHVHVPIAHGFNIGGARQPKGCLNSQHSHDTAEVFLVHSGEWAFRWGHDARDGEVILRAGDVISLPVRVFRGFECLSDGDSFLFAILGGDDPGHVTWAPDVFEKAKDNGLYLLKSGVLVDTMAGDPAPHPDDLAPPTTIDDVARFRRVARSEMEQSVVSAAQLKFSAATALAARSLGVREAAILGPRNRAEDIDAGGVPLNHGFHFRCIEMNSSAFVPRHKRSEEEVVFVHAGGLSINWHGGTIKLSPGDTFTAPIGMAREWRADPVYGATVYVVRGGDQPSAPVWLG